MCEFGARILILHGHHSLQNIKSACVAVSKDLINEPSEHQIIQPLACNIPFGCLDASCPSINLPLWLARPRQPVAGHITHRNRLNGFTLCRTKLVIAFIQDGDVIVRVELVAAKHCAALLGIGTPTPPKLLVRWRPR